jgi:hypothetical protein
LLSAPSPRLRDKTMILRNVAQQATVRGYTVRFTAAGDMLSASRARVFRGARASHSP